MPAALAFLATLLGAAILLLVLADLWLTSLVVGGGGGFLTTRVARGVWNLLRALARAVPRRRDGVLSMAGPVVLATTAGTWALGVWLGVTLVVWPWLGTHVVASSGATPRDLTAAAYFAGFSLTTLGTGDLVPDTPLARVAMVLMAALGFALLTLVVTYLMSVYAALVRRNALARGLEQRTEGTGEPWRHALALLTGTGRGGVERDFEGIHAGLVDLHESHHAYPVLHYFRFERISHSVPWMAFAALEVAHLIGGVEAPGPPAVPWSQAPAWRSLARGASDLLEGLGATFLPERVFAGEANDEAAWAAHFDAVHDAFAEHGVEAAARDEARAAYLAARREWEPWVRAFARQMGFEPTRITRSRARRS